MTKSQIKGYFDRVYNGQKNFMANKRIDYRKKKNVIMEMSEVKIDRKLYIGCTFLYLKENCNGHLVAHRFGIANKLVDNKDDALFLLDHYSKANEWLEEQK